MDYTLTDFAGIIKYLLYISIMRLSYNKVSLDPNGATTPAESYCTYLGS